MKIHEMTVSKIQEFLRQCDLFLKEEERAALSQDPRTGVRRLYVQYCRQRALAAKERLRLENMLLYEKDARREGFTVIAGVDEAGRGPLAGPVVASAVILPQEVNIPGVDDSKKLSPVKREHLFHQITKYAVCWSVGISDVEEIDGLNILRASLLAMQRAVQTLKRSPDFVLVDAVRIPGLKMPQLPIVKGDGKSISIAAASIVAKVTRDKMMDEIDKQFPCYGFACHKGYGTSDHMEALRKYGPCPIHRKAFLRNLKKIESMEVYGKLW